MRARRILAIGLAVGALALVAWALPQLLAQGRSLRLYERIAEEATDGSERDWDGLIAQNPDTVAWLTVGGTGIDLPVVASGDPAYYLSHDFWKNDSQAGCPFIILPNTAGSAAVTAYGHKLYPQTGMFSDVMGAWEQTTFDGIGELAWETPDGRTVRAQPLCAAMVSEHDGDAARTDLVDTAELRGWLKGRVGAASAVAPEAEVMADGALRAITLVTCASPRANQPWRTALTFVAVVAP